VSGFTKLVPEIVQSSIWNESAEVRCVWIAMIATKDKDGNIRGNRLALARLANVPVESVDIALRKFQAPDPDSNNQENEGRRIEAIPGGWHIISHAVYRAKDYREHEAERKKLYREKKQMSGTCPGQVPDSSVSVSVSDSAQERGCKGETPELPLNTRSTPVESKPTKPKKEIAQPCFESPSFLQAWQDWQEHRREIKKPLTPRASQEQMKEFRAWGEVRAIKAIRHTIKKQWVGIREEDAQPNANKPQVYQCR
jgi:hypothetical protein